MATEELSSIRDSIPLQQASKHSSAPPDFSVSLGHTYVSMEVYVTCPHHSIPRQKKWGKPKTKMSSWLEVQLLLYLLLSVLNRINIQWNCAYFSRVSDLIIRKSTDYAMQIWRICRVRKGLVSDPWFGSHIAQLNAAISQGTSEEEDYLKRQSRSSSRLPFLSFSIDFLILCATVFLLLHHVWFA